MSLGYMRLWQTVLLKIPLFWNARQYRFGILDLQVKCARTFRNVCNTCKTSQRHIAEDPYTNMLHFLCRLRKTLTRDTHLMQQFIYYYKQLYLFRASICPSSGVLGCILTILVHMVSSTRCCGWGSEEPVCSLVHWCKFCIFRAPISI